MTSKRPTIPVMEHIDSAMISRAQGCLLGQLAGDALGSMVEFERPEDIRREYPDRIREHFPCPLQSGCNRIMLA